MLISAIIICVYFYPPRPFNCQIFNKFIENMYYSMYTVYSITIIPYVLANEGAERKQAVRAYERIIPIMIQCFYFNMYVFLDKFRNIFCGKKNWRQLNAMLIFSYLLYT